MEIKNDTLPHVIINDKTIYDEAEIMKLLQDEEFEGRLQLLNYKCEGTFNVNFKGSLILEKCSFDELKTNLSHLSVRQSKIKLLRNNSEFLSVSFSDIKNIENFSDYTNIRKTSSKMININSDKVTLIDCIFNDITVNCREMEIHTSGISKLYGAINENLNIFHGKTGKIDCDIGGWISGVNISSINSEKVRGKIMVHNYRDYKETPKPGMKM